MFPRLAAVLVVNAPPIVTATRSSFATMWVFSLQIGNYIFKKYIHYRKTLAKTLTVVEDKLDLNASMVLTVPPGCLAMYGRNNFKNDRLSFDFFYQGNVCRPASCGESGMSCLTKSECCERYICDTEVRTRTWAGHVELFSRNHLLTNRCLQVGMCRPPISNPCAKVSRRCEKISDCCRGLYCGIDKVSALLVKMYKILIIYHFIRLARPTWRQISMISMTVTLWYVLFTDTILTKSELELRKTFTVQWCYQPNGSQRPSKNANFFLMYYFVS